MRKKTDKKLISFTNLSLVEGLVKDEAELKNCSESAVIESKLMDGFLPKDKNARFIVENYLYSDEGGIGKTLEAVFSMNAAGVDWGAKYDNLLPLVEFAKMQECLCGTIPTGEKAERYHCCSQLDSVIVKLEHLSSKESDMLKKHAYQEEIKWAKMLLKQLQEEPQSIRYANIYQLLLNNWQDLKGWSITYRLLADLVALGIGWTSTAETRAELLQLLRIVSDEWNN